MRPTWVLGDPHVGHDADADHELLALLDRAAVGRIDLVIMGDLFVAWIGREACLTPAQLRIIDALRAIRAAGGSVRLVVGNRDYLADRLLDDAFDAVYETEVIVDVGGAKTMLLHGDGLNENDRPYRWWRRISRSPMAEAVLSVVPGPIAQNMAASTERRLRDVNVQYKQGPLPLKALRAVSTRARIAGAERAIVGHFHEDTTVLAEDGVEVRIAPGWFEHRVVLHATPYALLTGGFRFD